MLHARLQLTGFAKTSGAFFVLTSYYYMYLSSLYWAEQFCNDRSYFFFYTTSTTWLHGSAAGYASAYPAYPVAPPLLCIQSSPEIHSRTLPRRECMHGRKKEKIFLSGRTEMPGDADGGGVIAGDVVDDEAEVGADGAHEVAEEGHHLFSPHHGPREY